MKQIKDRQAKAETTSSVPVAPAKYPYRSCAQWPESAGLSFAYEEHNNVTGDGHNDADQAEGVCKLLMQQGLGGERIHFPLFTWVERTDGKGVVRGPWPCRGRRCVDKPAPDNG